MSIAPTGGATGEAVEDEEKTALKAELTALRADIEKSQSENQELTQRITQLEQNASTY